MQDIYKPLRIYIHSLKINVLVFQFKIFTVSEMQRRVLM